MDAHRRVCGNSSSHCNVNNASCPLRTAPSVFHDHASGAPRYSVAPRRLRRTGSRISFCAWGSLAQCRNRVPSRIDRPVFTCSCSLFSSIKRGGRFSGVRPSPADCDGVRIRVTFVRLWWATRFKFMAAGSCVGPYMVCDVSMKPSSLPRPSPTRVR